MDSAVTAPILPFPHIAPAPPPDPREAEKRTEFLLDALKAAIADPGDHRLFRWGKLAGLFPSRSGPSAAAASLAVRQGLLETVRTETKGKLVVEWVRATPKAVGYVHDHDSPKAVLRELRDVIGETRAGVPVWMQQARDEAAQLALRFEHQAREMTRRLDALAERVEAALRRVELSHPGLSEPMGQLVPWGLTAVEYLDRRKQAAGAAWCRLPELFHAVRERHPELTLSAFHDGLRRLADTRAVRLAPAADPDELREPEYAVVMGGMLMWAVGR